MDERATSLFRSCDPVYPLEPGDSRYVDCDAARGDNIVEILERSLIRADPAQPDVKVFSGHRGIGKTSELLRLKKRLESHGFLVVYFDVEDSLDVNDLDYPDLLVLTADQLLKQLKDSKLPGFGAAGSYMSRLWDEIRGALVADVAVKDVSVDAGFGSLAIELRNRPNARAKLRSAIEQRDTSLRNAVNDELNRATEALRNANRPGLVLIIDGLEKLTLRKTDDGSSTHDRLFVDRCTQLSSFSAHCIYTVPISLVYSPQFTVIEEQFGEFNSPLGMIRLRGKNKCSPNPNTPGMKVMEEIIRKRCEHAKVNPDDCFDSPDTMHLLCEFSGGHPRHLLSLMQAAINEINHLPITRAAADRALQRNANSLLRELPDVPDYLGLLKQFDTPQIELQRDDVHRQMLYYQHVFEYMNAQPWWEVNPVFRRLPSFQAARVPDVQ